MQTNRAQRGSALLTVLWLTAALSAIAFSVATSVRGETERASTHGDQTRAYFLAVGAVERALLWMQWGPGHRLPDGRPRYWAPGISVLPMAFPGGAAIVEIIPESARMNVNRATPEELMRLLAAMGVEGEQARVVAGGILEWRATRPDSALPPLSGEGGPTFRPRGASIEQIEELLCIRGVTPDLFHGTWVRNANGVLVRRPGLKDCLTVYALNDGYDINTTPVPAMIAIGIPPDVAMAIAERRAQRVFVSQEELTPIQTAAGPAGGRLRIGGNSVYTLRATATPRQTGGEGLVDVRRSVAMVVKFNANQKDDPTPYWILRWHDNAGTN